MRFHFIKKRMDSELFIQFLQKLRTDANRPLSPQQESTGILKENEGSIMVAFLPTYSLGLNPDEQVWNHAKLQLGKRAIKSEGEMKKHLISIMKSIQKCKELIKSFFGMPDTRYINQAYSD